MQAVVYLHKMAVMHRDLKPENFLLLTEEPEAPIKLIDFGLATRFKSGELRGTKVGTPSERTGS